MPHDPRASIIDMLEAITRAYSLARDADETEFLANERIHWAVYSQIVILGEAASRLPRDFCREHPHVPWSTAIGMRHRLVHGYDNVDWPRVWKTLQTDLQPLREELQKLLPEGDPNA